MAHDLLSLFNLSDDEYPAYEHLSRVNPLDSKR